MPYAKKHYVFTPFNQSEFKFSNKHLKKKNPRSPQHRSWSQWHSAHCPRPQLSSSASTSAAHSRLAAHSETRGSPGCVAASRQASARPTAAEIWSSSPIWSQPPASFPPRLLSSRSRSARPPPQSSRACLDCLALLIRQLVLLVWTLRPPLWPLFALH